jgi:hypothetical protein
VRKLLFASDAEDIVFACIVEFAVIWSPLIVHVLRSRALVAEVAACRAHIVLRFLLIRELEHGICEIKHEVRIDGMVLDVEEAITAGSVIYACADVSSPAARREKSTVEISAMGTFSGKGVLIPICQKAW